MKRVEDAKNGVKRKRDADATEPKPKEKKSGH